MTNHEDIKVGDRIRFDPQPGNNWWTVRARDARYIIATQQAPFQQAGEHQYTIVDLVGYLNRSRNGAGPGIVRSSLNTIGGGYDIGNYGMHCDQMLADLHDGWELSARRAMSVKAIEVAP